MSTPWGREVGDLELPLGGLVVGGEALQGPDRDRVALLADQAEDLALLLLRADASADRREAVLLLELIRGFEELALLDQFVSLRHSQFNGYSRT